jgi:hypothetical protein
MTYYTVRCRNSKCRHRRNTKLHPDDQKLVWPCPICGQRKGWRIEAKLYNKRNLCNCSGVVDMERNREFTHRKGKHPSCDHHPEGIYNQARARGVPRDDIPAEYRPKG